MPETAPSASTASTLRPLIDTLSELVGAAHVLTHDDPATDLSAWENDWRKRQQGRALAVVEVKQRATVEAALEAVSAEQRDRLRQAAQAVAASRPRLKDLAIRLDLIALAPGRLPAHRPDAWRGV